MDIIVDGKVLDPTQPKGLLEVLFQSLPRRGALLAAEFCTQTALAPYFCAVKETLGPDTHFVDGGRQSVEISTVRLRLLIEKPFRVVDFNETLDPRTLFFVSLSVNVNLVDGKVYHTFNRSTLAEQDWVIVDDDSTMDSSLPIGTEAKDVAASALRLKRG